MLPRRVACSALVGHDDLFMRMWSCFGGDASHRQTPLRTDSQRVEHPGTNTDTALKRQVIQNPQALGASRIRQHREGLVPRIGRISVVRTGACHEHCGREWAFPLGNGERACLARLGLRGGFHSDFLSAVGRCLLSKSRHRQRCRAVARAMELRVFMDLPFFYYAQRCCSGSRRASETWSNCLLVGWCCPLSTQDSERCQTCFGSRSTSPN